MGTTISNISEMGCWCYFNDDHGRGKGQPISSLDEICKILHDGYECAMRDAEFEGTTCVPWEVAYNSAVGGNVLSLEESCTNENPGNNCAKRACCIEGNFVTSLLELLVSDPAAINQSHKHSNGF